MSPGVPFRRMFSSVARVGVNCALFPLGDDQRKRVEIKRRLIIVRFLNGREQFITQTEIQREAWSQLEVVERVSGINLPAIVDIRVTLVIVPPSGMPSRKVAMASPPP